MSITTTERRSAVLFPDTIGMLMFNGLSAFPLTPTSEEAVDEEAFARLVSRLSSAGVDTIGALGSTGSYAYLGRRERQRVARIAVDSAGDTPVIIGIGSLRTRDVLHHARDAQEAGAAALLLAPMSYQKLTEDEVFNLYETVDREISVPLCVYDNPATTHFNFTDDLYRRVSQLNKVKSIKIPGVPAPDSEAKSRVEYLRTIIPSDVTVGVSGDPLSASGLLAGCDLWYSVIAGILPEPCIELTRAAQAGDEERVRKISSDFEPLWKIFGNHGSLRVVSAIAEDLRLVAHQNLPLPIQGLSEEVRSEVRDAVSNLGIKS